MLQRPNVRLATIVGPGGIGKTRLALSVAEDISAEFPDGVYFVNLAAITDPDQVLLAIGGAAGIPIEGDAIDALSSEFQDQQVLLVIDNFEHVAEGGSSVADLLGRSPGLKVLATSRVPLRIMSEYEYTLEPLGLPATGSDRPDSVSASDAVRLFIDRALAVIPGFSIDEENASPVASIVRIVDGLPLAIELAAARLRMLSPGALSERLTKISRRPRLRGGRCPQPATDSRRCHRLELPAADSRGADPLLQVVRVSGGLHGGISPGGGCRGG